MATLQGSAAVTRSEAATLPSASAAEGRPLSSASGAQEQHRAQHHQQHQQYFQHADPQHDRQYPTYSQHQQHGRVEALPSISSFHNPSPQSLHHYPPNSISLPPPSHFASRPPPSLHMASQTQPPSHHPPPPPQPPPDQQQHQQQMSIPQANYYPQPHSQGMMPQPTANAQHPQAPPSQYGPPPGYDPAYGGMPLPQSRMQGQRAAGKEIKRRTKTGCLTCRKRRIKCDEGHPQCKNCIKSKRECAGYDPMFKPHPQGNQSIRPAASSTSTSPPTVPASLSAPAYAAPPPGSQALPPPSVTAPGIPSVHPPPASIDPNLQQHHAHPIAPPHDKFGAGIDDPGHHKLIAKPTRMEELINIGNGREPPIWQRSDSVTDSERAGAEDLFRHIFAYGLDLFFETLWFGKRGWTHLVNDAKLLEKVVLLHSRMGFVPNTPEWDQSLSLEGHIIWDLIMLCRHVSTSIKTTNAADAAQDLESGSNVHELAARTQIFESLVTNQRLDAADIVPMSTTSTSNEPVDPASRLRPNERADRMQTFWHHLSKFCSLREPDTADDGQQNEQNSPTMSEIENCLSAMRSVLDQNEPRDILYSVAIARHHLRPEAVDAQRSNRTNDESDPATQLHIARSFIYHETRSGTSPIMTRIARIVIRSWVPSG